MRVKLSVSATIVSVVVVLVCAGWGLAAYGSGQVAQWLRGLVVGAFSHWLTRMYGTVPNGPWVAETLRSRSVLISGAIAMVCLVGLYILAGTAWRLGRTRRENRPRPTEAGTAAIEFALLFPFALMIVLVMIQSMLLAVGNLAVHHAAYAAARSAVVWVPENLSHDEPRNITASPESSAKFHRVRLAAVYAVMPVSAGNGGPGGSDPGSAAIIQDGLERFWQLYGSSAPRWVQTMLEGKCHYAWNFTEVSLSPPSDGNAYGDHETLRVQVRHTLYLSVPYANRIFGDSLASGHYGTPVNVTYSLTNQGVEDEIDVEQFPRYVGR